MYKSSSGWHVFYLALPKSLYKVTLASMWYEIKTPRWNEFCLAQHGFLSKTAPAYKESRFKASSQWYKVKTPSEWLKINSSSSSCPEVSKTPAPEVLTPGRA